MTIQIDAPDYLRMWGGEPLVLCAACSGCMGTVWQHESVPGPRALICNRCKQQHSAEQKPYVTIDGTPLLSIAHELLQAAPTDSQESEGLWKALCQLREGNIPIRSLSGWLVQVNCNVTENINVVTDRGCSCGAKVCWHQMMVRIAKRAVWLAVQEERAQKRLIGGMA